MKKMYVLWAIVTIFLLSVITFIGFNIINKNKGYKNLEDSMEAKVSQYLGQYINEYPSSGSKRINITDVINNGFVLDMSVNGDTCDGYVVVKKVSFAYEYDGYIKCSNYVTKGYSE